MPFMQVPMGNSTNKHNEQLPLAPHPVRDRRARSGIVVRLVYGLGVLAVGLYFAWYFGRSLLFLEGAGIVAAPVYNVSTPYLSQIVHMNVTPGIEVSEGDLITTVTSPDLDREVNDLDRMMVEQSQKEADLRIRLRIARATLDLARNQVALAEEAFKRLDPTGSGVTSLSYRMDVYRERSIAALQQAQAEAEADEVQKQLERFAGNRRDINIKKHALLATFNDGQIRAQVDGIVGIDLAHTGEVIKPGDQIAGIYDISESYIQWHLPSFSLREPRGAEEVYIHYGSKILPGYIYEIQHIAEQAPSLNQSMLREKQQQQVVLVKLLSDQVQLPINAQVIVRMNYSDIVESLTKKLFGGIPQ